MCSLSPLSFSDILPDMENALLCRWNHTKKRDEIPIQKAVSKFKLRTVFTKTSCSGSRKSQLYRQTFKSSYPRSILRCQISEKRFSHFMCGLTLSPPAVRPQAVCVTRFNQSECVIFGVDFVLEKSSFERYTS